MHLSHNVRTRHEDETHLLWPEVLEVKSKSVFEQLELCCDTYYRQWEAQQPQVEAQSLPAPTSSEEIAPPGPQPQDDTSDNKKHAEEINSGQSPQNEQNNGDDFDDGGEQGQDDSASDHEASKDDAVEKEKAKPGQQNMSQFLPPPNAAPPSSSSSPSPKRQPKKKKGRGRPLGQKNFKPPPPLSEILQALVAQAGHFITMEWQKALDAAMPGPWGNTKHSLFLNDPPFGDLQWYRLQTFRNYLLATDPGPLPSRMRHWCCAVGLPTLYNCT